ncbi:Hypothetical_protein [Hexamita inflata]|uniref:Hypothetical_protein n=1 Tax=Hexamita inflata TaxID=28002 RepID=A0AA86PY99_9EUKA|nr:Hypothetical protein HINF_LOCUS35143 [Hexamita inflata]
MAQINESEIQTLIDKHIETQFQIENTLIEINKVNYKLEYSLDKTDKLNQKLNKLEYSYDQLKVSLVNLTNQIENLDQNIYLIDVSEILYDNSFYNIDPQQCRAEEDRKIFDDWKRRKQPVEQLKERVRQ